MTKNENGYKATQTTYFLKLRSSTPSTYTTVFFSQDQCTDDEGGNTDGVGLHTRDETDLQHKNQHPLSVLRKRTQIFPK